MTVAAHVPLALALSAYFAAEHAILVAVGIWLATTLRFKQLSREARRPLWITRFVDEPVFAHWAACVLLLGLSLPVGLLLAVLRASGRAGSAPLVMAVAYAGTLALAGWGVWGGRRWVRIRRVEVPIEGLGCDFDGYRVVQLSDLHIGNYDRLERGLDWAAMANDLNPDLTVVTGDLVTDGTRFYPDVARVLGALRARDGVVVAMGNHDQWDNEALTRMIQERGPVVLRNGAREIRRGVSSLAVAGIDDRYTGKADLDLTLRGCNGLPTVLLAHYPDFFEPAAARGVSLVLSGHTHGGQFAVPGFGRTLNLARLIRQRPAGLFASEERYLYVNAGLGTTGPPLRIGVAPEITEIILRPRAATRNATPESSPERPSGSCLARSASL